MEIYEFEKTLLNRLEESMNVLSWKDTVVPASKVRTEWAYFMQLWIEPTGWQAIWKIPRLICEDLDVRYPTVVFGMVEQVNFQEMKAVFNVQAVQDDFVHLAEYHQVSLVDLYPTTDQENTELNVQRTAECIDRLRFFYNSVWMPWDNDCDEDVNWPEKHLESRIRFYYDLLKRNIKRPLAAHIKTLLYEARYVQQRRELIESDISDDSDESDLDNAQKSQVNRLMRLHLRLAMIRHEFEMFENPDMRRIYEKLHFDDVKCIKPHSSSESMTYVVMQPESVKRQMEILQQVERLVGDMKIVQLCSSLQECLHICNASDKIYLAPGRHPMKFLDYLNDNGSLIGAASQTQLSLVGEEKHAEHIELCSAEDDSMMLVFDGGFTLQGLRLDCTNTRTGLLIKNGCVLLKDCILIGDKTSSTSVGIQVNGDKAKLILENCVIKNFTTGIISTDCNELILESTIISDCSIAMQLSVHTTSARFGGKTLIENAKNCGIFFDAVPLKNGDKCLMLSDIAALEGYVPTKCVGECAFTNCKNNIYIINELESIISTKALRHLSDDFDDVETVESNCL